MPAPTDATRLTEPLRALQKTGVEWTWTTVHQQVFEVINAKIASAPVLRYFDEEKPI